MPMIIDQKKFIQALSRVNRLVDRKATMPVLRHVLLRDIENELSAVVTDLTVFGEVRIDATGTLGEPLTVEVIKLKRAVAALATNKSVSLEQLKTEEEDRHGIKIRKVVLVVSGPESGTAYTLLADKASEFPKIKKVGGDPREVPAKELLLALRATAYAVSTDEHRFNICNLNVELDGNGSVLVATSGHCMAVARVPFQMFDRTVLIPGSMLGELEKMLASEDDRVLVYCDDLDVGFKASGLMLSARICDGLYPDWQRVIPKKFKGKFTVDAEALYDGVKRVTALAVAKGMIGVTIKVGIDEACLEVVSDGIKATEKLAVTADRPDEITMQKPYILDAVKALGPGLLRVELEDGPHSPAKISHADDDDGPFAIVMGMRV